LLLKLLDVLVSDLTTNQIGPNSNHTVMCAV